MPDSAVRKAMTGVRRSGRRSLSAYGPQARGARASQQHEERAKWGVEADGRVVVRSNVSAEALGAAGALLILSPLARRALRRFGAHGARSRGKVSEGTEGMKKRPAIESLETISPE